MTSPKPGRCPICRAAFARDDPRAVFPFCSPRCRAVDLGRWFDEAYRVDASVSERDPRAHPPQPPDATDD